MPKARRRPIRRVLAVGQVLPPQPAPQAQPAPTTLPPIVLVPVQVGVGEEDGDLLLAAAVAEAEAPGRGLVVGIEAAVELVAGGAVGRGNWRGLPGFAAKK